MSDALLPYYNRELGAIRQLAGEFAQAHPKIAGRLRLSADAVDDPHVARLLEGVAFLSARVHHRLDDEFPQLTDALLDTLYPHYLAPVPSCAIVQLAGPAEPAAPSTLPAGLAIESEAVRGEICRFRTTQPVTLWPIAIDSVRLSGLPLTAPPNPRAAGAVAVLRIGLRCLSPEASFAQLGLDRLRLFLRGGANLALPLYELLCAHTVSVAFAEGPNDPGAVICGPDALAPAGFAPEEALFPWPARSFSGFRLLTEYFAFPEKFLFLDIKGMEARTLLCTGGRMDVFVYLDRSLPELERAVSADALALGCAPAVNLFQQRCEPIALTGTQTEYRIEPDVRRPHAMEVWRLDQVRETRPDGTRRAWQPFYRLAEGAHAEDAQGDCGFYQVQRRASPAPLTGMEAWLAPFDPAFDPQQPGDAVLSIDALCTNRDLPSLLPFGGGHPALRLAKPSPSVTHIACLTAPTAALRAPLREQGYWRLVSHVSLGHLSVVGGADAATALKEVLRLYDLRDTAETRAAIEALTAVSAQPGTARVPGARSGAFCRGMDVRLEFEARAWQGGGLYLLAAVLDRFLALHATVNSFVRCGVGLQGRAGRVASWPARAGARVLV